MKHNLDINHYIYKSFSIRAFICSNSASASSSSRNTPSRNKQIKKISYSSKEHSKSGSPRNPIASKTSSSEEMVQRFTKRSAIYTLPMTKRKLDVHDKIANNETTGKQIINMYKLLLK